MALKTIFFDLDHTLWDYDTNARETLDELYDHFQLDRGFDSAEAFFNTYVEHNAQLWNLYNHGKINREDIRERRFFQVLDNVGLGDRELAESMSDQFMELCPRKTALIPGTLQVLEALQPDYQLGVITNGFSDTQDIKLSNSRLKEYFHLVVTSESARSRKPSPEIFHTALNQSGHQSDEVVMIGDNRATDIAGALAVGWKTIWYTDEAEAAPENCWKVEKLQEIPGVISSL